MTVSPDSALEGKGFEPSVPLQGCAGNEAVAATGLLIIRRGQYRFKPWSGDDPAGASEIRVSSAASGSLRPSTHATSRQCHRDAALSRGTPEFRVLQQLEPADDLCAPLFCKLLWQ